MYVEPYTSGLGNWTTADVLLVRYSVFASATVSLIGGIIIISSYPFLRALHAFHLNLVVCLSLSDLGLSLSYMLVPILPLLPPLTYVQEVFCLLQAAGIYYFELSSPLWTSCLAFHAYCHWVREDDHEVSQSRFKWYVLLCWVFPLIPTIWLLMAQVFGPTDELVWCWVGPNYPRLRTYLYIPTIIFWFFNLGCYLLVRRKLIGIAAPAEVNLKITAYIVVFVIVYTIAILNRFILIFHPPSVALFTLQAFTNPSLGFFNAIAYGITNRSVIHLLLQNCCCRGRRSSRSASINSATHIPFLDVY